MYLQIVADTTHFMPFVRCVRDGEDLICTPWSYDKPGPRGETRTVKGKPVVIRQCFEFEAEQTVNPKWVNYKWTLDAICKLAGLTSANKCLSHRWLDGVYNTWTLEVC